MAITDEKRNEIIKMKRENNDLTLRSIAYSTNTGIKTVHTVLRKAGLIEVRQNARRIGDDCDGLISLYDFSRQFIKPVKIPKVEQLVVRGRTYYDYTDLFQKQYEDGYTVLMKRAVN